MSFLVVAASILVALACGGSDGSNSSASNLTVGTGPSSYAGTIDKTTIPTASTVRVGAFQDGDLISEVVPTQGSGDEDHTFTIAGLQNGDYTVSVYRVIGSTVDTSSFPPMSEDDRLVLLSSPATVTGAEGVAEAVSSKTSFKRQINVITTFVVNRIANDNTGATNVSTVLTELFGSVVASLDEIDMSGGEISSGSETLFVSDDTISQAIQFMSTAIAATSVLGTSSITDSVKTNVTSTFSQLSLVTNSLTAALSSYSTLLATASTENSSAVTSLIAAASSFVNDVLDGDITNLTTSLTPASVAAADANTYKVLSFGLASGANNAYGTTSGVGGVDFSLNTLAPVFKLSFVSGNTLTEAEAKALLTMTVTDGTTTLTESGTVSSQLSDLVDVVADSPDATTGEASTFYLLVKKDYSSTTAAALEPGKTYTYTLTATDSPSKLRFGSASSRSGTITTKDVTITLPYAGASSPDVAAINLSGNATHSGLSADQSLVLYVDAANGVQVDQTDAIGYGIVGSDSALNISVYKNGSKTASATDSNVEATDVMFFSDETGASVTSGMLTLDSAVIEAGTEYSVTISTEDGLLDSSGTAITSYPTALYIETEAAE